MNNKFIVISGPCVIESEDITRIIAEKLKLELEPFIKSGAVDFYFKASFDKANRTSINSFRGPGIEEGLNILKRIKEDYSFKIVTDIHEPYQAALAAEVCDILQIPAFLCRQTDLLVAAAKTGKLLNIKKAQFLAPWDMSNVVKKVRDSGNDKIMLCERGTTHGYNQLVVDMTSIMEMHKNGCPVIFDATHSVQKPGGNGTSTSGNRDYIPYLAKAAVAAGADGLFMETHVDPSKALSDGPNMININDIPALLSQCIAIREIIECQNN
ncbi:3-deoxy-8-phosphooctulonate synthase [Pseudobutyrivibrio ruminis]|uniref:3-deoxy-8-phosphooctulonate synthase n=1 Tax=Pseudobutyrivibrio ruminis TaxID=46206 RepID=UPI00068AF80F|nr:3-deoxy-8-phosphooctulonate synthase [Pseudobutyrivibrio ruminis]